MITLLTLNDFLEIKADIFPDKTSQIWHLPQSVMDSDVISIRWDFEEERELFDICNLGNLLQGRAVGLIMKYLPYARQDKGVYNDCTFSLNTFAKIINQFYFESVISFDPHSSCAEEDINNFKAISPFKFQTKVITQVNPTYLVFPDKGAFDRYPHLHKYQYIIFEKKRNQDTGEITGHKMIKSRKIKSGDSFLIVDDLCDGGATFCSVSKALHSLKENIRVDLCVSHGIFSKGVDVLHKSGINEIWTTNSLKQKYQVNVIEV